MSAETWDDLMRRAEAKGADLVQFEVNLARANAGPSLAHGLTHSWCVRAGKNVAAGKNETEDVVMLTRFGRTGEEAFRSLVEALEKGATK